MIDLTGVPELPQPQVRADILEAVKRAKDNLPPYPTELLTELGAFIGKGKEVYKQDKPQFRGWHWQLSGCWDGMVPNNVSCGLEEGYVPHDLDLSNIGYIGIWRSRIASPSFLAYCVVPSMVRGLVEPGAVFDIGDKQIRIGWKQNEIDAMIRESFGLMQELIKEHGAYEEQRDGNL